MNCNTNSEPVTKDIVKDYLQEALSVNGGKYSNKKFKRNEIVRFKSKTGKKIDMKFARYLDKNMVTLRFMNKNKKGTINVNLDRIEKMPKSIANTKLRQRTRRANLVRKKRGIKSKSKSKSSTLSLPSSEENVDDLLKGLKYNINIIIMDIVQATLNNDIIRVQEWVIRYGINQKD